MQQRLTDWGLSEELGQLQMAVETDIAAALVAAREAAFPDPESVLTDIQDIGAPA
jgi:hypothetical protein